MREPCPFAANPEFLEAAAAIGDELCARAVAAPPRWPGLRDAPALYDGSSGVLLFLSQLARATGEQRFADAASAALRVVRAQLGSAPPADGSWMHGSAGIALACDVAGEALGEPGARALAREVAGGIEAGAGGFDLFGGDAGAVVLLAALHERIGDPALVASARRILERLLARGVGCAPSGIYLRTPFATIVPLCGLGHGASGLALACAELFRLAGDDALRYVARSALAYEDSFYDPATANWIDGRIYSTPFEGTYDATLAAYARDGFASWSERVPANRSAWCSGKAGFLAARLRVRELLEGAGAALPSPLDDPRHWRLDGEPDDFTWCCGHAALADAWLHAGTRFGRPELAAAAAEVGARCLRMRRETGAWLSPWQRGGTRADSSLMKGLAGVGYLFLRLADPRATLSLLLPCAGTSAPPAAEPGELAARVRGRVLARYWAVTASEVDTARGGDALGEYLARGPMADASSDIDGFDAFLEAAAAPLGAAGRNAAAALATERDRIHLDRSQPIQLHRRFEQELLCRPLLLELAGAELAVPGDARATELPGSDDLLVVHTCAGTSRVTRLSGLARRVYLAVPREPRVEALCRRFGEANPGRADAVAAAVRAQLRILLQAHLLVAAVATASHADAALLQPVGA